MGKAMSAFDPFPPLGPYRCDDRDPVKLICFRLPQHEACSDKRP